jgi:hypothetical protein
LEPDEGESHPRGWRKRWNEIQYEDQAEQKKEDGRLTNHEGFSLVASALQMRSAFPAAAIGAGLAIQGSRFL